MFRGWDVTDSTERSVEHQARDEPAGWLPTGGLNVSDGDVSIHFFASNSIKYLTPVFDPFFSANGTYTSTDDTGTLYAADQYVNVMGCVDQRQVCGAQPGDLCTLLSGYNDSVTEALVDLGLNQAQMATFERLAEASLSSNTYSIVSGQNANSVQANKLISGFFSPGLPSNQWQIELEHWFQTGLANMQQRVVDYVDNPWAADPSVLLAVQPPQTWDNDTKDALTRQCSQQRVQSTNQYQNFSFVGVVVVLVVSVALIVLSWFLEGCVNKPRKAADAKYHHKYQAYRADGRLQLLRAAHERAGYAGWQHLLVEIPHRSTDLGMLLHPRGQVSESVHGRAREIDDADAAEAEGEGTAGAKADAEVADVDLGDDANQDLGEGMELLSRPGQSRRGGVPT